MAVLAITIYLVGCQEFNSDASSHKEQTRSIVPYYEGCEDTLMRMKQISNNNGMLKIEIVKYNRLSLAHEEIKGAVIFSLRHKDGLLSTEGSYLDTITTSFFNECMPTKRIRVDDFEMNSSDSYRSSAVYSIHGDGIYLYFNNENYEIPDGWIQ